MNIILDNKSITLHAQLLQPRHASAERAADLQNNTPLLMLHGWGQTLLSLRPLGERLALCRTIHLLDLPGFGQSPWPGDDWTTRDYAHCILAYLDAHEIAQVDLLGHSFGGRIGLRIASEWPQRIKRLILVDSAGLPRQRTLLQRLRLVGIRILGQMIRCLPTQWAEPLRAWHRQRYGSKDYLNAGVLRGTLVKTVNEDQTDNAKRIQAPTLLVWGEHDQETPVAMAYHFKKLIPHAQLVILPGLDHFPFIGPSVHTCAQVIDDFLHS